MSAPESAPEVAHHSDKETLQQTDIVSMGSSEKNTQDEEKSLGSNGFIDKVAEARLVRKLDTRLIPLMFSLYLMSYLDRSNIGNAKIAGMSTQLKFDKKGNDYAWLLTIFYVAYIVFEWAALMWKVVPPHIWAACMVLGFGICGTLQAATTSWGGMMALRFLLGAFEAGFGPGVPFYLSFFYMRRELGLRIGMFLSAGPLATCFSGALAYGITSGKHPKIANWKILFLVEGLPSICLSIVAFLFVADSPIKAKFLNDEDKAAARAREVRQVGGNVATKSERVGGIVWSDIAATAMDPKSYIIALMYFSCNVSFSSLPVFLPTILTEMGFTAIDAQGLSAPPYFLSFLAVIATTFIADRTGQRGLVIFVLSLIGAVGYILLAATKTTAPRYFGVYLASIGIFPSIINILPWALNNQGSDTKRGAGIAIVNLVGQCGPLLGTRVYPTTDAPLYIEGMWTCAAFMLFNCFLALALRTLLQWENKKLDAKYGPVQVSEDGSEETGIENDGPNFRYVL